MSHIFNFPYKIPPKSLIKWIVGILLVLATPVLAVHTVILKEGDTIRGRVIAQNSEMIYLLTEGGANLEIPKKTILKVLYKEITPREESEIRSVEEAKILEQRKKEEEKLQLADIEREKEKDRLRKEKETPTQSQFQSQSPYPPEPTDFFTAYRLYKSYPNPILTLASPKAVCKPYAESSDWYALFGTIPLTRPHLEELIPSKSTPIQIRSESNWKDITISIIGSVLVTISRKTVVVDICEELGQPKLLSEEELLWELELLRKQEEERRKEQEQMKKIKKLGGKK